MTDQTYIELYRFGDVTLDVADFRILKGGEPRHMTPRAFEVLHHLVLNRGRVISKQELFDKIWNGAFVTDNALTRVIKELRGAIGDDADSPTYIETVPKRGYRFIAELDSPNGNIATAKGVEAIAVLPLSTAGSSDVEFLAEGLWESICNQLSRIPDIRVIPRSVMYRLETSSDPVEAGLKLRAGSVICGSVRRDADDLWVDLEMIDVGRQARRWGQKYHSSISKVYELEESVSTEIAGELKGTAGSASQPPTRDSEAYLDYLKGRYFWNRRPQGIPKGIEYFENALKQDGQFALAYAGLADCFSTLGSWENGGLPPTEAMPKALDLATRALGIDNSLVEATTTLAYVNFHYEWNPEEADRLIEKALKLDGNYVHARHWLSHFRLARGDVQGSLEASHDAYRLDPLDLIMNVHLAWHHWMAREADEALVQAEKTHELHPNSIWPGYFAGLAYEILGQYDEAIRAFQQSISADAEVSLTRAALAHVYGLAGEKKKAREILVDLESQREERFIPAYDLAIANLGLQNTDSAIEWLLEAVRERSGWVPYAGVEPRLDPLRGHPEYKIFAMNAGLKMP